MNTENFKLDKSNLVIQKNNLLAWLCPKSTVEKIRDNNKVAKGLLLFVILLSICSKMLDRGSFNILMIGEVIISILIFVAFLQVIFWIANGKISFVKSINLSVYIHSWVIFANICSGIPIVSVITFIGAQLLGVYLQYLVGIHVVHADTKRLKNICLVELLLILFSLVVQLLTTWGIYVAYSTKIYHFPLA